MSSPSRRAARHLQRQRKQSAIAKAKQQQPPKQNFSSREVIDLAMREAQLRKMLGWIVEANGGRLEIPMEAIRRAITAPKSVVFRKQETDGKVTGYLIELVERLPSPAPAPRGPAKRLPTTEEYEAQERSELADIARLEEEARSAVHPAPETAAEPEAPAGDG